MKTLVKYKVQNSLRGHYDPIMTTGSWMERWLSMKQSEGQTVYNLVPKWYVTDQEAHSLGRRGLGITHRNCVEEIWLKSDEEPEWQLKTYSWEKRGREAWFYQRLVRHCTWEVTRGPTVEVRMRRADRPQTWDRTQSATGSHERRCHWASSQTLLSTNKRVYTLMC